MARLHGLSQHLHPRIKIPLLNISLSEGFKPALPLLQPSYIADIEVFYRLHYLNTIRQYTWLNYYDEAHEDFRMAKSRTVCLFIIVLRRSGWR
ncbi:uncharacterized protein PAC_18845 [Phialocephala subalpina]|uniref:Uncharacterized protein n=1 Tax=Phialocephala subalpina TaxID=576137 RepID=A0A1L7XV73_9HELO|nr:uncharacterized protein PAC_18845 [Phialocephala subalpina]